MAKKEVEPVVPDMKKVVEETIGKHLVFEPDTQRTWIEFLSKLQVLLNASVQIERGDQSRPSSRVRFVLNITTADKATRRLECLVKEGKVRVE